jgi:hypothetical protein
MHIPLIERILEWKIPASPKLERDTPDPVSYPSIESLFLALTSVFGFNQFTGSQDHSGLAMRFIFRGEELLLPSSVVLSSGCSRKRRGAMRADNKTEFGSRAWSYAKPSKAPRCTLKNCVSLPTGSVPALPSGPLAS